MINLSAKSSEQTIVPTFEFAKGKELLNFTAPSDGMGNTRVILHALENASLGPSILSISANSSFPPGQLLKVRDIKAQPENVKSKSNVFIFVNRAPDWLDKLNSIWGKVGDFTTFLYGIIVGISPFIYTRIRKYFSKKGESKLSNFGFS